MGISSPPHLVAMTLFLHQKVTVGEVTRVPTRPSPFCHQVYDWGPQDYDTCVSKCSIGGPKDHLISNIKNLGSPNPQSLLTPKCKTEGWSPKATITDPNFTFISGNSCMILWCPRVTPRSNGSVFPGGSLWVTTVTATLSCFPPSSLLLHYLSPLLSPRTGEGTSHLNVT